MTNHLTNPPKPPFGSGIGICATCRYWDRHNKERVIQQGQGVQRVSDMIAAGMKIPTDQIMVVAQCTHSPMWSMVTDNHWCWQYMEAMSIVRDNNPGENESL